MLCWRGLGVLSMLLRWRVSVWSHVRLQGRVRVQDMYVDFNLSLETAAHIKGLRMWMTNELQHSGIRDDGAAVLERLLSMTRGNLVHF